MDSNGIDISPKDLDEQSSSSQSIGVEASVELDKKLVGEVSDANAFRQPEEDERTSTFVVGSKSKIEQLEYLRTNSDVSSTNGVDHQRSNSLQQSPVWEGTRLKDWSPSPRAPKGLDHCTTAPVGTHKNLFFESHEIPFSRSMIEKRENPRPEINLDRLSELEKDSPGSKYITRRVIKKKEGLNDHQYIRRRQV